MKETGGPLHGAIVLIVELGRSTLSGDDGAYEFDRVPPGRYHLVTHLDSVFSEAAKTVEVRAGDTATADFMLALTAMHEEITVTASDKQETAFESFGSVDSFNAQELSLSRDVSLGEALDHKVGTGIAKRSFGPGSSRPIVRGFDGDRVLVMEDGIRTGTLSSQSGDHGEVVNTAQLERLEVVKGPATLLYSGNAIGGTVNAIGRHHEIHRHPHQGLRGYLSASAGHGERAGRGQRRVRVRRRQLDGLGLGRGRPRGRLYRSAARRDPQLADERHEWRRRLRPLRRQDFFQLRRQGR